MPRLKSLVKAAVAIMGWALVFGWIQRADASVSVALIFDDLVKHTTAVGVMKPVEKHSVWEGGRIVTYTRVRVENGIEGELGTGAETWVATLGGTVGEIGQIVDGEPNLEVGTPALLFLRRDASPGTFIVTGRAQGQYDLVPKRDMGTVVRHSNAVGALVLPKTPVIKELPKGSPALGPQSAGTASIQDQTTKPILAGAVLDNRRLDDVVRDVSKAWKRLHAHKR